MFSVNQTLSQTIWAPNGATWHYDHSNIGGNSVVEIFVEKDTIIDDLNCQCITGIDEQKIITCQKENLVYLYREGQLDTLYNFNASVGESWIMYDQLDPLLQTGWIKRTVVQKGDFMFQDEVLFMLIIDVEEHPVNSNESFEENPEAYSFRDTIVERIGSLQSFILPWDHFNGRLDGHVGGPIRCYNDLDLSFNRKNIPCDSLQNQFLETSTTGYLGVAPFSSWIYQYNNGWTTTGYHLLEFGQDRIIQDKVAKRINRTEIFLSQGIGGSSIDTLHKSPLFIYESPGLVEIWLGEAFDTFHYHGGQIDDSWTNVIPIEDFGIDISMISTIIDIGQIEINQIEREFYEVKYEFLDMNGNSVPAFYTDTIVSGIGNISGYILPWHSPPTFADYADGGPFRCFYNDGDLIYQKNENMKCDFVVSNNHIDYSNEIKIFPNPSSETISVQLSESIPLNNMQLSIYDIMGQPVRYQTNLRNSSIDISTLDAGIYIIQFGSHNQIMGHIKFYKSQ